MAIVIEKEKKGVNWFAIFTVIIIVAIIGIAGYLLFFSEVPLAEKVIPYQLEVSDQVSQLQFQSAVQVLTNNKFYQSLQSYVILPLPSSDSIGKTNPFK